MQVFLNRKRKKTFTLLEVLISFVLVSFCMLPLIYPHVAILKEQHKFLRKIQLDHAVNLYSGHLIEKLHKSEIPWYMIEEGKVMNVDEELLQQLSPEIAAFKGVYSFEILKSKPKKAESGSPKAYLLKLRLYFLAGKDEHSFAEYSDKKNPYQYDVDLFVRRL